MKCPGQDTRYWKPGDIFEVDCPECGNRVEFFKDEATRKCRQCRHTVVNPRMDFGCAAYCKYAADCLGELGPELLAKRNDLLKDKVALEVKRILGSDFQRIAHGVKVARFIEEAAHKEKSEPALLLCAAYLHVLDETTPDGSDEGVHKKAREILEGLGAGIELIEQVVDILDSFRRGEPDGSLDGRLFFDAHERSITPDHDAITPDHNAIRKLDHA